MGDSQVLILMTFVTWGFLLDSVVVVVLNDVLLFVKAVVIWV